MAESQKPHDDERIEELLSQLQGIFGKLSHSEEEESRQKVDVPASRAPETTPPSAAPPVEASEPAPSPSPPSASDPVPVQDVPPPSAPMPVEIPSAQAPMMESAPASAEAVSENAIPTVPVEATDNSIVYTALFYPSGREAQAKILAEKVQNMAPKFTKVAFQLGVAVALPYEPKSDWKEFLLANLNNPGIRALFMVIDRPLEDVKRKALIAELETRGIYFQEVPLTSIEKKAFYTDLLLGLVFFFDSRKPPTPEGQE